MVIFDQEKCILCGKCIQDCYPRAIQEKGGKLRASEHCMLCGHCVAICPKGAVSVCDYEDEPEEYIKEKFQIEPANMLRVIKFRRSVRNYRTKKIEKEKLEFFEKLFRNAPAVIYITGDNAIDAGLAAQNMELMAVALGLGIFYNGYLTEISGSFPEVKAFLQTGEKEIQLCFMAGYPAVEYRRTAPRKKPEILWM